MTECLNADVRDRLPDFVHGQLSGRAYAEVAAHVAGCAACTAEVALIRDVRGALRLAPPIDVARVVAALPSRRPRRLPSSERTGWQRLDWRIAAAITVLAIGGGSAAVISRIAPETSEGGPTPSVQVSASPSIDAFVDGATPGELEALLADLEAFDGLPARDPELTLTPTSDPEVDG